MPAKYQLCLNPNLVRRVADDAYIPNDPDNADYRDYLAWRAEGNVPDAFDDPLTKPAGGQDGT